MPKHTLFVSRGSAPCRAVLYLLSRISAEHRSDEGVQTFQVGGDERHTVEVVEANLDGSHVELLGPHNPLHCVPTLVTPHGPVWESRAIMQYLAELAQTLNPDAWTFYPRKLYQRAVVNRLLDWDQGTFYKAVGGAVYPLVFRGEEPTDTQLEELAKVVRHLDEVELADGRPYLTGNDATIADFSIAMGMSMLRLAGLEMDDVPLCEAWLKRMAEGQGWAQVNEAFEGWVANVTAERTAGDGDDQGTSESSDEPADQDEPPADAKDEEPEAAPEKAAG